VTYDAFVSYAKEDEAQARAFCKRLESAWVSLESSIFVTLPERTGGETRRVIVIDFGGPRLPGWLRYDLALAHDRVRARIAS
jgi:hypothetical protein